MNILKCGVLFIVLISKEVFGNELCVRAPLGTKAAPLPPDDRFELIVEGIIDDRYIPSETYTVRLSSTDMTSTFIAFTISILADTEENILNPRRRILLQPGQITPSPKNDDARVSEICANTLMQSNVMPKHAVEVEWKAPPKYNGCVTIYAVVAVKIDIWYKNEGPLIKKICEDQRQKEDMQPSLNNDCNICEEARYLLTFEGTWNYNTHSDAFPINHDSAHFSDLVGASHSNRYDLWKFNKEASRGLKMLVEQGNTTELEIEIQKQYQTTPLGIRTVIKAEGMTNPNIPSHAIFRVNRDFHRISIVTAILPSPDWFLGVAHLELCDVNKNEWADNILLNLYPLDAGTDSGKTFESPNDETSPPQPISSAKINNAIKRPYAKLIIKLVRTYEQLDCINSNNGNSENPDGDESTTISTDEISSGESENKNSEPSVVATNQDTECPLSEWEEWLPCAGDCENGIVNGFQTRVRYHLVDGIAVDKYVEDDRNKRKYRVKNVPQYCRDKYYDSETRECEEPCETEEPKPEQNDEEESFLDKFNIFKQ